MTKSAPTPEEVAAATALLEAEEAAAVKANYEAAQSRVDAGLPTEEGDAEKIAAGVAAGLAPTPPTGTSDAGAGQTGAVTGADGVEHVGVIPVEEGDAKSAVADLNLPNGTGNSYWARQAALAVDGVEGARNAGLLTYLHVLKAATFKAFASIETDDVLVALGDVSATAEAWTQKLEAEKALAPAPATE